MIEVESYELETQFDSAKSFYGKAIVKVTEDEIVRNYSLLSYGTLVAIYSEDKMSKLRQYVLIDKFSATTTRHQKEFFKQFGLDDSEIKEIMKTKLIEKN